MDINLRKAAIVGCGYVGASIAFRFLQQGVFSHHGDHRRHLRRHHRLRPHRDYRRGEPEARGDPSGADWPERGHSEEHPPRDHRPGLQGDPAGGLQPGGCADLHRLEALRLPQGAGHRLRHGAGHRPVQAASGPGAGGGQPERTSASGAAPTPSSAGRGPPTTALPWRWAGSPPAS